MPRPCKCRHVGGLPKTSYFKPTGIPLVELEEVTLPVEGLEAIRLADWEGLDMDEASRLMGVSRHTFGRVLRKARRSVAEVLIKGCALRVEGGSYNVRGNDPADGSTDTHSRSAEVSTPATHIQPGGGDVPPVTVEAGF